MSFIDLAQKRFSCRKFSDKAVEKEKADKIIQAGLLAPTGMNKQPFKIFAIQDSEKIEKLKLATPFTFGAQLFLLVCADENKSYVRPFDNKNFAQIDTAIVATHMMLEIADLGLGTTWVGHFDEKILKEQFPKLNGYCTVAIFPIGYPDDNVQISPMHSASKAKEEIFEIL